MSRMPGSLSFCISRADGELAFQGAEGAEFFRHRRQPGIFHRQIAELALSADDGRVGQRAADFLVAVDHFFEPQSNRVFHANHCKGRRSSYSARHATKHLAWAISLAISLALAALLPVGASALSTTNSDNADLVLADMALSRGDCRGGTDRYLKAALATSDAKISERANKVASECQQIGASAKAARRWQKLDPESADAAAAVALAAVRLYQPDEASAAILRTQALGGDEALIKLIGELSDAGGTAIALNTLRPMLESPGRLRQAARAGVDLALENLRLHHRAQTRGSRARPTSRPRAMRARSWRGCSRPRATRSRPSPSRRKPRRSSRIPQRFAYADTLLRLDRLDEARQELESLRTDASVRDEADLRLGKLAYQMGDMTEAGRRFGSLIVLADGGGRGVLLSVVHRRARGPHRSGARGLLQARRSRRGPHRARPRGAPAA